MTDMPFERDAISVYVNLPAPLDAAAHRAGWERGEELEECPYGFQEARGDGFRLTFSRSLHRRRGPVENALKLFDRATGLDLTHAWRNRTAIEAADIVWTVLEGEAVAILILCRLGLLRRRPLIAGTVWILDRWHRLGPARRLVYARLLADASLVTVHAQGCLDRLREVLPGVDGRLLAFGVPAGAYDGDGAVRPGDDEPIHIVAAGHDRTRDWPVLLEAFGNDPRFRLTILCRWFDRTLLANYDNVSVPETVATADLPSHYRSATYVAVPMRPNIFSGITVALEAAAAGTPILSSHTGGVPTYFADDQVLYVAAGDAHGMRERVLEQTAANRQAMAERARRRFLTGDYSTRGMARRYREPTAEILRRPLAMPIRSV